MNAPTDSPRRVEVYYSGRVQGVGFRYTAQAIAGRFAISGFVENLADGRVLLMAEGQPAQVTGYLAAVEAELERYISGIQRTESPGRGEFDDFRIRR